jgi:hypothetical protein
MDQDKKTSEPTQFQSLIEYKKVDDFATAYANNVFMESSLWDLKLIFGQNDQGLGPNAVVQHTAITLPWAQVKVLKHFLEAHLIAHEIQNGRIHLLPNIVMPVPDEPPQGIPNAPSKMVEIHAALKSQYEAFAAENPEAVTPQVVPVSSKKQ